MTKKANDTDSEMIFSLERHFPTVENVFSPQKFLSSTDDTTIVILDTNVLLLPYVADQLGKKDIKEIENLLQKLKEEKRIFIPERVAREFIRNRDGKIADLVKSLNDKKSRISPPDLDLSKLFQHMEQFNELGEISKQVAKLIKQYKSAYTDMVKGVKSWKGDDPITIIYNKIFNHENIIGLSLSESDAIKDWEFRKLSQCPPGYKDAKKEDTGIGDYLIWKTLIETSISQKKDVIFVTGDQKNDWFVRGDNEALFVRPELIDEFRRETKNHQIRIIKFDELLSENNLSESVVEEIKRAEHANVKNYKKTNQITTGTFAGFDYSTNNGTITVSKDDLRFNLKFSKASRTSIHIYSDGSGCSIARIKNAIEGEMISINNYDNTSRNYTLNIGDAFIYIKPDGSHLIGRILEIQDDSRGDPEDFVFFAYEIHEGGIISFIP